MKKYKNKINNKKFANGGEIGSLLGSGLGLAAGALIPGVQPFIPALMGLGSQIGGLSGKLIDNSSQVQPQVQNTNQPLKLQPQNPYGYGNGGGIHINPKNKGKFTSSANRAGKSVQAYAHYVMAHSSNPTLRKRANFAINASKWHHKHENGGSIYANGGYVNNDYQYINPDIQLNNSNPNIGINYLGVIPNLRVNAGINIGEKGVGYKASISPEAGSYTQWDNGGIGGAFARGKLGIESSSLNNKNPNKYAQGELGIVLPTKINGYHGSLSPYVDFGTNSNPYKFNAQVLNKGVYSQAPFEEHKYLGAGIEGFTRTTREGSGFNYGVSYNDKVSPNPGLNVHGGYMYKFNNGGDIKYNQEQQNIYDKWKDGDLDTLNRKKQALTNFGDKTFTDNQELDIINNIINEKSQNQIKNNQIVNKYAMGGNIHPLFINNKKDFVDSTLNANNNLDWVNRLYEKNAPSIRVGNNPYYSTHLMSDDGNGYVFPEIIRENGILKDLEDTAENYARRTKTGIQLPKEQGDWFANNGYKLGTNVNNSINNKNIPYNNPNFKLENGGNILHPTINVEKDELEAKNGRVFNDFTNKPKHPSDGSINPMGNTKAQSNNVIIPAYLRNKYLSSDLEKRKLLENQINSNNKKAQKFLNGGYIKKYDSGGKIDTFLDNENSDIYAPNYQNNKTTIDPISNQNMFANYGQQNPNYLPTNNNQDNQNTLGKGLQYIAPYIDNITNAILTANTPQIPKPLPYQNYNNIQLKSNYDIRPQLNDANTSRKAIQDSIASKTNSGSVYRASANELYGQNQSIKNRLYNEKNLYEQEGQNKNTLINAEINQKNIDRGNQYVDRMNQYNYQNMVRKDDIQSRISQNTANFTNDLQGQLRDNNLTQADIAKTAMIYKVYNENGVLDRAKVQNLLGASYLTPNEKKHLQFLLSQ